MFSVLDLPGATLTLPDAITDAGDVVGLSEFGDGSGVGFHIHDGTVRRITCPGATRTAARGINAHGEVVGRFQMPDGRWLGFVLRAKPRRGQPRP